MKDVKSLSIALSRIKHDNVKITRKGGAGLQRDNNLAGKIQREWTLGIYNFCDYSNVLSVSEHILVTLCMQKFIFKKTPKTEKFNFLFL
jgi:hypothetical protein